MMNRLLPTCLLSLFCFAYTHAAYLTGLVTDMQGEPLPFANVYVEGTSIGTTTNEKGQYRFELKTGTYKIVYLYIGYQKHVEDVIIGSTDVIRNVALKSENIQIKEIVVTGDEDPAYPIMRKAIAAREAHYNQVTHFKTQAYVKGLQRIVSAPDKVFGQTVNFDGTLDSNNAGIVYLSESVSELTFKKPDQVSEEMISSKVSGSSSAFSWNRSGDFAAFDFYTERQEIDFLSPRVFISPLADNAFFYYKFRLEGWFEEDGRIINKIKVIPKRPTDPVYRGYIYVVENEWLLHSLELMLLKESQINYIDTLNFNYRYVSVEDSIWMPLSQRFSFNFGILGIKAEGYLVAVYRDYELNPELEKKTFTNEVLKITEESNERDSTYWEQVRPVPLTKQEEADYERKDSLEELRESKPYLDSMSRKANKPGLLDLVFGYRMQNLYKKWDMQFTPPLEMVQYNTVEGVNLRLGAFFNKELKNNKSVRFNPIVRYGFSNTHFNGKAMLQYYYQRKKFEYIQIEAGQYVYQFNREDVIPDLINSFYTLFLEQNYLKIYEERFARITYRRELANGLVAWVNLKYGRRYPLENSTSARWTENNDRSFTSNIPFNELVTPGDIVENDIALFALQLRWVPGLKYMTRPDRKILMDSKFPTFGLVYKKAIPDVIQSDANFDLVELSITQNFKLGLFGNSNYKIVGGGFINNQEVPFQDFIHFAYNRTIFGRRHLDGFQILDFYTAATNRWFVEGHYEHHFDGFFFNKIPGIRKLKFQLVAGVHTLYNPDYGDHTEVTIAIENILKVIRVDFVNSFSSRRRHEFGVLVSINFNNF